MLTYEERINADEIGDVRFDCLSLRLARIVRARLVFRRGNWTGSDRS